MDNKENLNPNLPLWEAVPFYEGGPTRIPTPDPTEGLAETSHNNTLTIQEALAIAGMELLVHRQEQLGRPLPQTNVTQANQQSDVQLLIWFLEELRSLGLDQIYENSTSQ